MRAAAQEVPVPVPPEREPELEPELDLSLHPERPEEPMDLPLHEGRISVEETSEDEAPRRVKLRILRRKEPVEEAPAEEDETQEEPRSRFSGKLSSLLRREEKNAEPAPAESESESREKQEQTPLDLSRRTYAEADRRAAEAFRKLSRTGRKERIREIEEAVARHKLTPEDRLWLAGDGHLHDDAAARREKLMGELQSLGLEEMQAHAVYAKEIARLEYESKKSERKRELASEEPVLKEWEEKLGKSRDQWSPEEVTDAMREAMDRTKPEVLAFILKERELLQKTSLEKRGSSETLKKSLEVVRKGTDWWTSKPRAVRLVGSTLAFTALHATTAGTAGLALFAGKRLARSLFAAGMAQAGAGLAGKAGEKLYGIKAREAELEKLKEESYPADDDFEKRFLALHAELKKDKRKIAYAKMAVMLAAGYGSVYGLQEMYELAQSADLDEVAAKAKGLGAAVAAESRSLADATLEKTEAPAPPPTPNIAVPAPVPALSAEEAEKALSASEEKILNAATIGEGEGIWHAVERQVMERVKLNPEAYGLTAEDVSVEEKFQAAVDRETGKLLAEEGLLNRGGAEAGTKAFVDFENSKINIEGRTWETGADAPSEPLPPETEKLEEWLKQKDITLDKEVLAEYSGFRENYLQKIGFRDAATYDAIGLLHVSSIIEQTDRTISSYPAEWRQLATALQEARAPHDLTLEEFLQRSFLAEKGVIFEEIPVPATEPEVMPAAESMTSLETPIRPGYTETMITRFSLGPALERQLSAHLGRQYTSLPSDMQSEIAGFLKVMAEGDRDVLKTDFDRLVPGEKVNFARLFGNKELLEQAFEFPREAELLESLHFTPEQVLDASYVQVIRNMSVADYLEAFEKGPRNGYMAEYGLRKLMEHDGKMTSFYVDEGHIELARLIEKVGLTPETRDLSVSEFLKRFGSDTVNV